jgi:hypothetical protein
LYSCLGSKWETHVWFDFWDKHWPLIGVLECLMILEMIESDFGHRCWINMNSARIFIYYNCFSFWVYLCQAYEYYEACFILMTVFLVYFLCSYWISWITCYYRSLFLLVCLYRMFKEQLLVNIMLDLKWLYGIDILLMCLISIICIYICWSGGISAMF